MFSCVLLCIMELITSSRICHIVLQEVFQALNLVCEYITLKLINYITKT